MFRLAALVNQCLTLINQPLAVFILLMNLVSIKCLNPQRIRNPYTKEWMVVPCRKCYACLINQSNAKALHLSDELKNYPFILMLTLTYDDAHVPCVRVGDSRLYRGLGYPPEIILDDAGLEFNYDDMLLLNSDGNNQFIGVLYYKDLQDFFKRLRITYERRTNEKFGWRYFAVGEYGTIYGRPHYHIVFYGNDEFSEDFRNAVIKTWSLHSWPGLDENKVFRYGANSVANYLSGYVNSISRGIGFYGQRSIKPKSLRSKNICFGVDTQISKNFQESVKRGLSQSLERRVSNPFEVEKCSKLGVSAISLLPKKYISSLFSVPAGLCRSSYFDFGVCIANALCGKIQDSNGNSIYLTNLSFRKYCSLRGLTNNMSARLDFILDAWNYRNLYKSYVIKHSMLEYERCQDKKEYFASRVNSFVDDLDKRKSKLLFKYGVLLDGFLTSDDDIYLDNYLQKYEKKLLPKHLKQILDNK